MIKNSPPETSEAFVEVFKALVRALCKHPGDCQFNFTSGQRVVLTVIPHQDDYGGVLGKKPRPPLPGFEPEMRTLDGLKVIFNRMAQRNNLKSGEVSLKGGRAWSKEFQPPPPQIVPPDPDWTPDKIDHLIIDVGAEMFGRVITAYDAVNESETKLTMVTREAAAPGTEAALRSVFSAVGAVSGRTLVFELVEDAC